jgi:hypothetical protein
MIYAIIKDEGDTVLSNEAIAILASSDTLKTKSSSTQTLTNNRPKLLVLYSKHNNLKHNEFSL